MHAAILSLHEDVMVWYLIKHVDNFILYISYEILFSYATSYGNWIYGNSNIFFDSVSASLILMFNYIHITDFIMLFINKDINRIGLV
jgi:hypothetical protein